MVIELRYQWYLLDTDRRSFEPAASGLLENLKVKFEQHAGIKSVFLLGSVARDGQDQFSDLDMVVVVDENHFLPDLETLFMGNYPVAAHFEKYGKHVVYLKNPAVKIELTILHEEEIEHARSLFMESRIVNIDRSILLDKTGSLRSILQKWSVPPGQKPSENELMSVGRSFLYYFESIHPALERGDLYRAFFHYSLALNKLVSFLSGIRGEGDFLYQPSQFFARQEKAVVSKLKELTPSFTATEIRSRKEEMFDLFMWATSRMNSGGKQLRSEATSIRQYIIARYPCFWRLRDISLFGSCRQGLVYRSSRLDRYPADELLAWLSDKGIRTLVDLRREDEIVRHGYGARIRQAVRYITLSYSPGVQILEEGASTITEEGKLLKRYASALEDHAFQKTFKTFLHLLADKENLPLLYHCHAGVDRTGLITALLLKLLGTSDERIVADYLMSGGHARREYILAFLGRMKERDDISGYLINTGLPAEVIAGMKSNLSIEQFASHESQLRNESIDES